MYESTRPNEAYHVHNDGLAAKIRRASGIGGLALLALNPQAMAQDKVEKYDLSGSREFVITSGAAQNDVTFVRKRPNLYEIKFANDRNRGEVEVKGDTAYCDIKIITNSGAVLASHGSYGIENNGDTITCHPLEIRGGGRVTGPVLFKKKS